MAFLYANIFLFLFLQLIIFSNGQNITIKGGYWLRESELSLDKIDLTPFSHLFCGFADINSQSNQLILTSPNSSFIQFTSIVQQKNPTAKTLLSIGGGGSNKTTYGVMATTSNSRKSFIDSSIKLARQLGFHGLDLSWIFPESASDMANLGILLNEWRITINTEARNSGEAPLLFTATVSGSPRVNDSIYPIQSLTRNLDWINLLEYGFYEPNWSPLETNSHAQLFDPVKQVSGSDGINQWIQEGVPPQKIVFGIPFFGYAWRLNNTNIHGLRAPAMGKSDVYDNPWMRYDQIRDFIVQHRATTVYNATIVGDYCYSENTWISYDDIQSVRTKVSYIKSRELLGYYAFDISGDTNWNSLLSHAASQEAGGVTQGEIVKNKKKLNQLVIILIPIGALLILILLVFTIWYLRWRQVSKFQELERNQRNKMGSRNKARKSGDNSNLQVFSFDEMKEATNNFSFENKLGEGGYGPVYEGKLKNGGKIAVKRLSETSSQGLEEFENEVILTAKLQHINLVKVVGFCIENEEKMLIYEYMPNKSLDYYIYNQVRRLVLNWEKRVQIIEGIIQGLLYLQEYSRLTIIHRDIKASNILLDLQMKPKISDFGMARMFKEDEVEANTSRIVGTKGYIPPEYAIEGRYSTKSDVFSFGVLLLQIISGKKNTCLYGPDDNLNLLEYAFEMWKDCKDMEFMDQSLDDTTHSCKLLKCMQIALLCVQKNPLDRPTMLEISSMFKNIENLVMNSPKRPAFSTRQDEDQVGNIPNGELDIDNATITQLVAR
ncbi:G-type lectin S-receptor-like serine/threonine-protein kinase At1g61550 isoform X1 [Solanum stenotomum]|uniref:G-type lectin S-receptor-like serine/threonine-protein kinase At1g61550 isoform X1 n=1 Tax=Solanum stenotomum TaxID=172797 RepID=UPI0020CFE992|nr:G-type lectin S-receptor-like serine/threonine-protein kinase At1g61550 isoform X1 [Solanum stenotomum]